MNYKQELLSWGWRIKKAGFDQQDFAKEVDVSPSSLSNYVNLKAIPQLPTYERIKAKLEELEV